MRNLIVILLLLACAWPVVAKAQKRLKPWTEWSRKESEAILNDSPWGQTQVDTDTSELFFRPQSRDVADSGRDERGGATNQATSVKYHIRFLSAKPIRQAITRMMELDDPSLNQKIKSYMNDFVERRFDRWIAVAVTFESRDQRYSREVLVAFNNAVPDALKNNTYLERKDGKRLFLHTYQAPASDGLGAKFIFMRNLDDRPFLDGESREVRFVSEVAKNIKLDRRFKVAEMIYDGQLEF